MLTKRNTKSGYLRIHGLLEELQENQELLQRKNRRLAKLYAQAQEFVDNVSHEFRTPLTVIKEYVSLVREGVVGSVTPEQARLLSVVEDRADDLNIMVDDMLDVSRLEAGMMRIWRQQCLFHEIVERVGDTLEQKARVHGVELRWEIADSLAPIYCDPEKAGRVLINLVINAIKFCGDPGVVRIAVEQDDTVRALRVSVVDNGPGIDREALTTIFERFKRLEAQGAGNASAHAAHGFGLGLNIAQQLVDINLGELDVESALGFGTTFSFTIPLANPIEVSSRYLRSVERARVNSESTHISVVLAEWDGTGLDQERELSAFLNGCLRGNDLCYQLDDSRWLLMLSEREADLDLFVQRVNKQWYIHQHGHPHASLPHFRFGTQRSWNVRDRSDEIIEFLTSLLPCQES